MNHRPIAFGTGCSDARSDPALGLGITWQQRIRQRDLSGRCSFFCRVVPYFSRDGQSIQIPEVDSGERAPIAAISSRQHLGFAGTQPSAAHIPSASRDRYSPCREIPLKRWRCGADEKVVFGPPQKVSSLRSSAVAFTAGNWTQPGRGFRGETCSRIGMSVSIVVFAT